eukprot:CAMPEP_0176001400 /NCGR_PEP_ID=MMETSP0120_2-20121206/103_1 /TAXON_ID=160619 /ORGANISM="Kryptoperidinium foliaceum, Strain CCMP 1326" /LENGTH=342 /DNA_ID=CAMNT_0017333939 /DNA_START=592 /DNA_END=1620 /DNA_ORIENTATION=+
MKPNFVPYGSDDGANAAGSKNQQACKVSQSCQGKDADLFPLKLHRMLEDSDKMGFDDAIAWMPDGKSFRVFDKTKLETAVMPQYFTSCKFKTFQRSLNLWGFRTASKQVSVERGSRFHPLFVRGRPELCYQMSRIRIKKDAKNKPVRKGQGFVSTGSPRAAPVTLEKDELSCSSSLSSHGGTAKPKVQSNPVAQARVNGVASASHGDPHLYQQFLMLQAMQSQPKPGLVPNSSPAPAVELPGTSALNGLRQNLLLRELLMSKIGGIPGPATATENNILNILAQGALNSGPAIESALLTTVSTEANQKQQLQQTIARLGGISSLLPGLQLQHPPQHANGVSGV